MTSYKEHCQNNDSLVSLGSQFSRALQKSNILSILQ